MRLPGPFVRRRNVPLDQGCDTDMIEGRAFSLPTPSWWKPCPSSPLQTCSWQPQAQWHLNPVNYSVGLHERHALDDWQKIWQEMAFWVGNSSRPPPYSSKWHRQGTICSCHTVFCHYCDVKLELWSCRKVMGFWKHEDNLILPYINMLPETPSKHWNATCLFVSQLQSWSALCQTARLLGNLFWEIFKSFLKEHSTSQ